MNNRGFSILEFVVIIVLLAIAVAIGMRYFEPLKEDAKRQGVEAQAQLFGSGISSLRAKLLASGRQAPYPTAAGDKIAVSMDGTPIYVNEYGWPANTTRELDAAVANHTAEECLELWLALFRYPPPAALAGEAAAAQARFLVAQPETGRCRYRLVRGVEEPHYFDYNLTTGQLSVTVPPIN